jgi:esterase/lipase
LPTSAKTALSAYDYLVNVLGYSAEQIVIYGISLGSTVASHVSTVRRAKGLISAIRICFIAAHRSRKGAVFENLSQLAFSPWPSSQQCRYS